MAVNPALEFPLSAQRKEKAAGLLSRAQGFWELHVPDDFLLPEPTSYEETLLFAKEIDSYFGYRINYYPLFRKRQIWDWPQDWVYFADINDEITEEKFKIDQHMRAVITAFRFAVERNRWEIIGLKRWIQAVATALVFLSVVIVLCRPDESGIQYAEISFVAGMAVGLFGWSFQKLRDSQLKTAVKSKAGTLGQKISNRVNNLKTNYTEYLAKIDREEKSNDMASDEWTSRSGWWMQLTMWNPKRIEYIEKFLQSEMQRTRIFMLRTGQIGRALALTFGLLPPLIASAALLLLGVHLPPSPLNAFSDPQTLLANPWTWFVAATLFSIAFIPLTLQSSLRQTDIADSLGPEPLGENARFADIELHKQLADQIKRDKEFYRQRVLEGSYPATNQKERSV